MVNNNQPFQGCCPLSPGSKPPKLPRLIGPPGPPGPQGIPGPQGPGGALAYGSLYNTSPNFTPVFAVQQKVVFTTNGRLSGTAPDFLNNEKQVFTSGVYEISMDLTARVISNNENNPNAVEVQFRLYINDVLAVPESHFEFFTEVFGEFVQVENRGTLGKTMQLELNPNDRLSIKVESFTGALLPQYRHPSLTVTKIAD